MKIGLSYDLRKDVPLTAGQPEDALEEYDHTETVEMISNALKSMGHSIFMLGGGRDFLQNILHETVDFVFNISEGRGSFRSREAQVPGVLEMLGIPYTGSDPECLSICLDKPLTKQLAAAAGIKTPQWRVVSDADDASAINWNKFSFPAIVKPAFEGSSKGIRLTSLAKNSAQAAGMAKKLVEQYHQPVMIEEFIDGEEVTVGLVGNSPVKLVGIMRVVPRKKEEHFVYSLEVKREWRQLVDYECPAQFPKEVTQKITADSINAFKLLGCRDFARVDFRVSPAGVPYFIEINPLPGLGDYSDLVIMADKMAWKYESLIGSVLNAAVERYPLWVSG